ncbi:MAG: hypothetical protein EX269_14975, partial [Acidimicrobiales bacterium]
ASGVHALDNACPHEGYGLVTGALDGELVTCQWHNWKFDAATGQCLMGEEDVACHQVAIAEDGDISVTVTDPTDEERREVLWPSLESAIAKVYAGQMSRDAIRLLDAGAAVPDVMWAGLEYSLPRNEWGPGHQLALAADCLTTAMKRSDDDQALPLLQGVFGLSEEALGHAPRAVPAPDASIDLPTAVEAEEADGAMAAAAALAAGDPNDALAAFIEVVSQHHLDYGHGAIYTQKAFEILDIVGWERASTLLPHLANSLTLGTREDVLPYMRKAARAIDAVDLDALAAAKRSADWTLSTELVDLLLDAEDAPIDEAVAAALDGAGIEGLLDALSIGSARRLLRYDLDIEFEPEERFGWLDITHALTNVRAARWAWDVMPGPHSARIVLFAVWLLFDSGRAERRNGAQPEPAVEPATGDLVALARRKDEPGALAAVAAAGPACGPELLNAAFADPSGAFIVIAHLVKLTWAAMEETETTGSMLPLLAAARYVAAPRTERFVARNVSAALDFIQTGQPPRR